MEKDFRILAMYLPQFYRTAENDLFWGEGFTDWVSVREAVPLFPGHLQPRLPAGERTYDPTDPAELQRQAALAADYGIDGFCFYHYYFGDGREVLGRPLEVLLSHPEIEMPFCLCWANDPWVRSWTAREDGNPWADRYEPSGAAEGDGVLIPQHYGNEAVWERHFRSLLPAFRDSRYVKKDGRPVFVFYKTEQIGCLSRMVRRWRELASAEGLPGLYLIGANMTLENDALDASLIHAPSQILPYGSAVTKEGVRVFSERDVWERILCAGPVGSMKTYYGGFAGYDDTPRRGRSGMLVEKECPEGSASFRRNMAALIRKNRTAGNEFVFLNAWNEWGEGNCLEPDAASGPAYLEAVRDVLEGQTYRTEGEYVLEEFGRAFAACRSLRVAVYGSGKNAAELVRRYGKEYDFTGVLDDRHGSGSLCGVPFVTREALAADRPDVLLLAVRHESLETVYRRVRPFCTEQGIRIFDMYGRDEMELHASACGQDVLRREEWDQLLSPYDVVSVSLRDTLILRDPRSGCGWYVMKGAARALSEEAAGRTLYFLMGEGDPEGLFVRLLREEGLLRAGSVLSEREEGRTRWNSLFRLLRDRHPGKRILHIGSDPEADVLIPRRYGIAAFGLGPAFGVRLFSAASGRDEKSGGEDPFARGSAEKVREGIAAADVVSFDLFDTLLQRNVSEPEDVLRFTLLKRAEEKGMSFPGFLYLRQSAQAFLREPSLPEIYKTVGQWADLAPETAEALMECEVLAEAETVCPGPGVPFLEEAASAGKEIVLTSDMYLTQAQLRRLLAAAGLPDGLRIFVSCECRKRKKDGLFGEVRAAYGGVRVFHIGDSAENDVYPALRAGIGAALVPSPAECAAKESAGTDAARGDSFSGGQAPFGRTDADVWGQAERYAEDVAAPLLCGYLTWLLHESAEEDAVFFPSRDGWLLYGLYGVVRKTYPDLHFAPSAYFFTSRAAALRAAGNAAELLNADHTGTLAPDEVLGRICGVPADALRPASAYELYHRDSYYPEYGDALREASRDAREGLLRYLEKTGLSSLKRCVFADFVSAGTTMRALECVVPFRLRGCFTGLPEGTARGQEGILSYCGEEDAWLLRDFRTIEYLIAAPHPAVMGFDGQGEPVFAEETRTEEEMRFVRHTGTVIFKRAQEFFLHEWDPGTVIPPEQACAKWKPDLAPRLHAPFIDDLTGSPYGKKK